MGLYPILALMPDGPDRKLALVNAERWWNFCVPMLITPVPWKMRGPLFERGCASSSRNTDNLKLDADFSRGHLSQILRRTAFTF